MLASLHPESYLAPVDITLSRIPEYAVARLNMCCCSFLIGPDGI